MVLIGVKLFMVAVIDGLGLLKGLVLVIVFGLGLTISIAKKPKDAS